MRCYTRCSGETARRLARQAFGGTYRRPLSPHLALSASEKFAAARLRVRHTLLVGECSQALVE